MAQLNEMLATVRKYLGQLRPTDKLLMGSLVVILLMALALVALISSRRRMVELLPGVAAADQQRAAAFLTAAGITNDLQAQGKLMVPADKEGQARAMLAENGKLPSDKTILFDNLLEKQSWINSRQQNDQLFTIALQNQLAQDIANFKGVRSATVILDVPEASGIGRAIRKPTASATVMTRDGSPLPQATVDAIAGYVAGSRSGLDIDRVRVIDASTGQQRRATSEADRIPTTYLEHAARVEASTRDKIAELLSYIPGVIVAVTAQVDVTQVSSKTTSHLPTGQGTLTEMKRSTEDTTNSTQATPGLESGFASNVSADISKSKPAPGNTSAMSKTEVENEIFPGRKDETVVDPRGMPTMVAVSVSVPYGFVEALAKKSGGAAAAGGGAAPGGADVAVDDAKVTSAFDAQVRPRIEAVIRPHVRTMTAAANRPMSDAELDKLLQQSVSVAMIPVELTLGTKPQQSSFLGGGFGLALGGGIVDKVVLGVLAAVALGMMFMLVRKGGKRADMPTAEELVGLPPELDNASDVIGDALEGDAPLAGIEVGEEEVQSQKMLEQVGELVKQSPQAAAKMLNRWISTAE